jgi:nucleoside-diphosphate-sugar epimerase
LKKIYGYQVCDTIEFVKGDLLDYNSLNEAIKGVSYIIHTANKVRGQQKQTFKDFIEPAQAMKIMIEIAKKEKVKRIVLTSSVTTMVGTAWKRG